MRGTWLDWPSIVIAVSVLFLLGAESEQTTILTGVPPILGWLGLAFGVVALLIRRGSFTPRK